MNGSRPVTEAELGAHLEPMREDIRELGNRQERFAEFMTGSIVSRAIQERVIKSRHFWLGASVAMFTGLVAALALIVQITTHR